MFCVPFNCLLIMFCIPFNYLLLYAWIGIVLLMQDFVEVITLLLSGSWADRREGLVQFQRLLRADRRLKSVLLLVTE